jgi:hypothetical protein
MMARLAWPRLRDVIGQREVYPRIDGSGFNSLAGDGYLDSSFLVFLMGITYVVCRLKNSIIRIHQSS